VERRHEKNAYWSKEVPGFPGRIFARSSWMRDWKGLLSISGGYSDYQGALVIKPGK